MSASEPAIVAPSYHLAGDPFGGLLIPQDLSRVSGEPGPPLRGAFVAMLQSTRLANGHDQPDFGWLNRARFG